MVRFRSPPTNKKSRPGGAALLVALDATASPGRSLRFRAAPSTRSGGFSSPAPAFAGTVAWSSAVSRIDFPLHMGRQSERHRPPVFNLARSHFPARRASLRSRRLRLPASTCPPAPRDGRRTEVQQTVSLRAGFLLPALRASVRSFRHVPNSPGLSRASDHFARSPARGRVLRDARRGLALPVSAGPFGPARLTSCSLEIQSRQGTVP
jgi:hypothetical protein